MTDPSRPPLLLGKHVAVTGAGSGIGAAVAARLSLEGAQLSLFGRRPDRLHAVAQRCADAGCFAADVSDPAAVERAFVQAGEARGPVHGLVNCAGLSDAAPFGRTDLAMLRRLMAVNLEGVFHCCQAVLPGMLAAGVGRIVTIASTAGLKGYAYVSAYTASKHAVIGLMRSLAVETATTGVTVNSVCPGFADTEMTRESVRRIVEKTGRSEQDARATLARNSPQQRLVRPDEVADTVSWLLGPDASAITGQSIVVAGGELM